MSVEDGIPEAGQAEQTQQETHDWEKDYKELQAEYTRSQQALKDHEGTWEDEQAVLARIAEKFPHMIAEEDEEEPVYEDPDEEDRPLTRAEFEEWKREQAQQAQAQTSQQQFETDFKTVLNGREITKHGDRAIRYALEQGEIRNADDLKKAVDEWFEEVAPPKSKPRVPHAVTGGQAATQVPDWDNMSQGEINQYMAERVRGHEAQT